MNKRFITGVLLTLLGAILWGFSGTCVQYLDNYKHLNLEWLVTVRLLIAGCMNVGFVILRGHISDVTKVFFDPIDARRMIIFGLFGVSMCQYSYFRSIAIAGVGLSTVLQYVAPTMIIMYLFLRYHQVPKSNEILSIILAFVGTVLIVLHGDLSLGNLNGDILFWGLISATGICVYTLQPVELLKKYGTAPIVGMGMLMGGVVAKFIWWDVSPGIEWDFMSLGALLSIIVLGTVVSFNAFMEGVKRIGAVKGVVLSSLEPISAAVLGWLLLGNSITGWDLVGFVLILSTVFILSFGKKENPKR